MEASPKNQQSPTDASAKLGRSKLKNSLRSSVSKLKGDKSPFTTNLPPSASKRARAASSVSKSVSVLDFSGKEKSAKPLRRLSTPSKSATKSYQKPGSNITPISEARVRKSVTTPLSDVSRLSARRKFNMLLSASYWLSQIKVSESASNHLISLGFFRLALEAGCERLRDELKAYAVRYNLTDLGETVQALFESYGIVETLEQLQISETRSQETVGGTQSSSHEAVNSSRFLMDRKPSATQASMGIDVVAKSASNKSATSKVRASITTKSITLRPAAEGEAQSLQRRSEKPRKIKPGNGQDSIKKQEKKPADIASVKPTEAEGIVEENKENMDGPPVEEISA